MLYNLSIMLYIPIEKMKRESEVKKSLFISFIFHVETREAAITLIKNIKEAHKKSSHVVYAFKIGEENSQIIGLSDDGEPSLTAGRPTLKAIDSENLTDTLIVTVRYFGGVLLGRGGLSRAYFDSAKEIAKAVKRREKIKERREKLSLNYKSYRALQKAAKELNFKIKDLKFEEKISCVIEFNIKDEKKIKESLESFI